MRQGTRLGCTAGVARVVMTESIGVTNMCMGVLVR
jgi:hypothetical protein